MYFSKKLKYKLLFISLLAGCFVFNYGKLFAQRRLTMDGYEQLYSYWAKGLETTRKALKVNNADFFMFQRFCEKKVDSLRANFIIGIGAGKVDSSTIVQTLSDEEKNITKLYRQFEFIKKTYPNSVEEYRHPLQPFAQSICDSAGCT